MRESPRQPATMLVPSVTQRSNKAECFSPNQLCERGRGVQCSVMMKGWFECVERAETAKKHEKRENGRKRGESPQNRQKRETETATAAASSRSKRLLLRGGEENEGWALSERRRACVRVCGGRGPCCVFFFGFVLWGKRVKERRVQTKKKTTTTSSRVRARLWYLFD